MKILYKKIDRQIYAMYAQWDRDPTYYSGWANEFLDAVYDRGAIPFRLLNSLQDPTLKKENAWKIVVP